MKFEFIYEKHFRPLVYFCNKYLDDLDESKDVAQEVFLKLHFSKINLSEESAVKTFLYKTAKNRCLNIIRHSRVIDRNSILLKEETESYFESQIVDAETSFIIYSAVNKLPEQKKTAIKMYSQGMTYEDIAISMGLSQNTVKTHIQVGFNRLRELLKEKSNMIFYLFFKKL